MSSTRTVVCTRRNSKAEDWEDMSLEDLLSKNKADRRAKGEARKAAGGKSAGAKVREPAIFLGDVAWNNLFPEEEVELTGIGFMEQLEKELTEAQVEKLKEDIKEAILEKKEEFCKGDFMSQSQAKAQLITLVTKIMMEEAGFVIDEVLEDCKKQSEELRKEKDRLTQHQNTIGIRKRDNDKIREETKTAIKEFTVILQEEVENLLDEEDGEVGAVTNTARILTQFLIDGNVPDLKKRNKDQSR